MNQYKCPETTIIEYVQYFYAILMRANQYLFLVKCMNTYRNYG